MTTRMSAGTALHEAGHIVLAETFGYFALVYHRGGQAVSVYYFDGQAFIKEVTPPLCIIGMGGYASELLFGDEVDLHGCTYDLEQVVTTYDAPFVASLLPQVKESSRAAVDAVAAGLSVEQRACLYVAYNRLIERREACLETTQRLQWVPAGAKWSNAPDDEIWNRPDRPV